LYENAAVPPTVGTANNQRRRYCSMEYYIGCDAHKKYSVFVSITEGGEIGPAQRVEHDQASYRSYLDGLPAGSQIAVESVGNWYWLIDEMEKAGHIPTLVNAGKAKLMMGNINKTDKLDAEGPAILSVNGTLPAVWIPPGELRDQRELARMRIFLVHIRTGLKNRTHATFAKYGITFQGVSDLFGVRGRNLIEERLAELPLQTRHSVKEQLQLLDQLQKQITGVEKRIWQIVKITPEMQLLMSIPGVGPILAIVIALEIGDVARFTDGAHLASYCGAVPRVKPSGGKTYYGKTRPDVNHYLKCALTESGNAIVANQHRLAGRHVVALYQRIARTKGHAKAIGALRRHLAEAAYAVLDSGQPYHEPVLSKGSSVTKGVCASLA
jgi:transposase